MSPEESETSHEEQDTTRGVSWRQRQRREQRALYPVYVTKTEGGRPPYHDRDIMDGCTLGLALQETPQTVSSGPHLRGGTPPPWGIALSMGCPLGSDLGVGYRGMGLQS